jgi:hypothetical protein
MALAPVDHDVRFSIVLTDNKPGSQRRHEFDAPAPEVAEGATLFKALFKDAVAKHAFPPDQLTPNADRSAPLS